MTLDFKLKAEPNGDLWLEGMNVSVCLRVDGTVVVDSLAPVQLTGRSHLKFPSDVDVSNLLRFLASDARP